MKKKLKDICTGFTKNIAQRELDELNGDYEIYGASGLIKKIDYYISEVPYIGIVKDGSGVGRVNSYPAKSSLIGTMQYIVPNDDINLQYLLYALRSLNLGNLFKGAAIPHIYFKEYKEFNVNVPSLPEQQKIAAHLDSIQSAIDNKKQQLQQLDELVKSKFVEMFGDVVQNSKNWDLIEFEQLGELARGVSKHRPRGAPELLGGKYPLIQTGDVANCDTYITEYTSTYSELGLAQSKMWKTGCLCITIAANIAKTGILTFDACFPDSVVGFIPNEKVNELYMHLWFSFFQSILEYQAPQTAQKNLNMATLGKLKICVPPIELQTTFAEYVQKIDSAKSIIKTQLNDLNELLVSKMDHYFS